ncbi:unnamed protein product [Prunus brigantina]
MERKYCLEYLEQEGEKRYRLLVFMTKTMNSFLLEEIINLSPFLSVKKFTH